jgi:hypothetical protein
MTVAPMTAKMFCHICEDRERGKTVRREESRESSRRREQQRNDDAEERRADEREDDLRRCESCAAGEETERDGAERTCPAVIGKDTGGNADKLCGVPRYVAHARQAFLWSTEANFLRHISLCG